MRNNHRLQDTPFVMIALNTDRADEIEILKAHGFKDIVKCRGVWEGQEETSYAVFFNGPQQLEDLIAIGREYNQDAILVVDSERNASVLELGNTFTSSVGTFKSITEAEALHSGNYTYVESINTYFKAG